MKRFEIRSVEIVADDAYGATTTLCTKNCKASESIAGILRVVPKSPAVRCSGNSSSNNSKADRVSTQNRL
jgi:hypothetical protein